MFLEELGLEESGVNRLIKKAYALLNLETFITAGEMAVSYTHLDVYKRQVTYILTKTNLTLALGTYKYKICANHGWAENYGDNNDSEGNASVFITR